MSEPIEALVTVADVAREQATSTHRTDDELEDARDAVSDAIYAMDKLDEEQPLRMYLSELQEIVQAQIEQFEDGDVAGKPDEDIVALVEDVEAFVENRKDYR